MICPGHKLAVREFGFKGRCALLPTSGFVYISHLLKTSTADFRAIKRVTCPQIATDIMASECR